MGTHGAGELFRLELRDGFVNSSDSDGGWRLVGRFLDSEHCRWQSAGGVQWTTSPDFELYPWVGVADGGARVLFPNIITVLGGRSGQRERICRWASPMMVSGCCSLPKVKNCWWWAYGGRSGQREACVTSEREGEKLNPKTNLNAFFISI
jgi:hypothetical protein